jgi:hypothetical protein
VQPDLANDRNFLHCMKCLRNMFKLMRYARHQFRAMHTAHVGGAPGHPPPEKPSSAMSGPALSASAGAPALSAATATAQPAPQPRANITTTSVSPASASAAGSALAAVIGTGAPAAKSRKIRIKAPKSWPANGAATAANGATTAANGAARGSASPPTGATGPGSTSTTTAHHAAPNTQQLPAPEVGLSEAALPGAKLEGIEPCQGQVKGAGAVETAELGPGQAPQQQVESRRRQEDAIGAHAAPDLLGATRCGEEPEAFTPSTLGGEEPGQFEDAAMYTRRGSGVSDAGALAGIYGDSDSALKRKRSSESFAGDGTVSPTQLEQPCAGGAPGAQGPLAAPDAMQWDLPAGIAA